MNPGRIFRKIGLPPWTFVGVGVSAILFAYLGALLERLLRLTFGVDESTQRWWPFLPQLIVFVIPFAAVCAIGLAHWVRHQAGRVAARDLGALRRPEGKRGIILLVSPKPESAIFAIAHHVAAGTLERVWLIPSNDTELKEFGGGTLPVAEAIEQYCNALTSAPGKKLEFTIKKEGVSPADSQDTFDCVRKIFRNSGYRSDEMIADFTGGTKPMAVGMIMACLPAEREMEYVSYNQGVSHGPFLIDYQHRVFDLIG